MTKKCKASEAEIRSVFLAWSKNQTFRRRDKTKISPSNFPIPSDLAEDMAIAFDIKDDHALRIIQDAIAEYSVFYYTQIFPKIKRR
jgi:hypothetical protein